MTATPTSAPADTEAPVIEQATLTPPTTDVSTGEATVQLQLNVSDNIAGLDSNNNSYLTYSAPSSQQRLDFWFGQTNLISGDANNGTVSVARTLPNYAEDGLWTLSGGEIRDTAGNSQNLSLIHI